jgi:hypothetical protein
VSDVSCDKSALGMADVLVVDIWKRCSWYGCPSKDEVQISCIEATFDNYLRPGINITCKG